MYYVCAILCVCRILIKIILLTYLCDDLIKRVYNITVFISYLTYSDYIFHGAALVALPCSCR